MLLTVPRDLSAQDVTLYVDDAYVPFSFKNDNGEADGIYIDILHAIFKRMPEYTVTLTPVPWKRGRLLMEKGKGLGLVPAFFHGHDWPYLYPYSLPLLVEKIISICQEGVLATPRPNWPDDYIGLRIGNVAGFDGWGGDRFYTLVDQGKIDYEEALGSAESITKLLLGRVQCIMMNELAFDLEFPRLTKGNGYSKENFQSLKKGALVGYDSGYIGYSKPAIASGAYPFHLEFRQTFDAHVYKMTKSGEIQAIVDRYIQQR
jgi:polar amino acid transport system substrate-binding protein